jgi:hypothetical protein
VRRSGGIRYSSTPPHIFMAWFTTLDFRARWRWVASFTPRPLYPREERPRYPLDRRLGGPQSQSGHCGEEEKFLTPAENRNHAVQHVARFYSDWAIPAPLPTDCMALHPRRQLWGFRLLPTLGSWGIGVTCVEATRQHCNNWQRWVTLISYFWI